MPYTTVQNFTYLETTKNLGLTVEANGGNLVIESWNGSKYITADTITADLVTPYFVRGMVLRFTPSGGCTFMIRQGD